MSSGLRAGAASVGVMWGQRLGVGTARQVASRSFLSHIDLLGPPLFSFFFFVSCDCVLLFLFLATIALEERCCGEIFFFYGALLRDDGARPKSCARLSVTLWIEGGPYLSAVSSCEHPSRVFRLAVSSGNVVHREGILNCIQTIYEYCTFFEGSHFYVLIPPDHLLLDSAPILGPLIYRWEINKFENC